MYVAGLHDGVFKSLSADCRSQAANHLIIPVLVYDIDDRVAVTRVSLPPINCTGRLASVYAIDR